jgi:hypothetical protein
MPHLMPFLFVDQPSHTNSFDSDASSFPQLQLTTIGAALIPHLLQHLKPQLQAIEDRALSRTRAQREHAALEFQEDVENTKWELDEIVEKGKQDLETEKGYKLDDLRRELREEGGDIAVDVADQVRWTADDVVDGTLKRLEEIDRQALGRLAEWELAQPLGRRKDCQCRNERGLRGLRTGKGGCRAVQKRPRTSHEPLYMWQAYHRSVEGRLLSTGGAHSSSLAPLKSTTSTTRHPSLQ